MKIRNLAGRFAEDKDVARRIRTEHVLPAVEAGKKIVLDFSGVDVATQSFIHALVSAAIRRHGNEALRHLEFKSCTRSVKSAILTVVDYSLEVIDA